VKAVLVVVCEGRAIVIEQIAGNDRLVEFNVTGIGVQCRKTTETTHDGYVAEKLKRRRPIAWHDVACLILVGPVDTLRDTDLEDLEDLVKTLGEDLGQALCLRFFMKTL